MNEPENAIHEQPPTKVGQRESEQDQRKKRRRRCVAASILGVLLVAGAVYAVSIAWDRWDWKDQGFTNRITVILTTAYVLATVAYVGATFLQWQALRDSIQKADESLSLAERSFLETRRTNRLTTRAWLLVRNVEIGPGGIHTYSEVFVTVRNFGKIPAVQITADCEFKLSKIVSPPEAPYPSAPKIAAIGPGATHKFRFEPGLKIADIEALARARGHGGPREETLLGMSARFTYTDALETKGDTGYGAHFQGGGVLDMTIAGSRLLQIMEGVRFVETPGGSFAK